MKNGKGKIRGWALALLLLVLALGIATAVAYAIGGFGAIKAACGGI